jgi:exopolyphosphatase / guanosine-5'-triphosphate,3'-diphosphate pyrophosphatase
MSAQRFAFIDIGTNTMLCLIAELRDGGRFRVLSDLAEITRLGQGLDQNQTIGREGEQRSRDVLKRYLAACRDLGVEEITAVGTSALRDARNSPEVRERWRAELGLHVRVISGNEEAGYSFLAVQRGLPLGGRELLVIDIGGGSTEFIRGNESGVASAESVNTGTVRLTERFLHSDPVSEAECASMITAIDQQLTSIRERFSDALPALVLVGIAGTFTTLAAVEKQLTCYSHSAVHGACVTLSEVRRQVRLFQSKTIAERKKIRGLEAKRADVILAGAYLTERIMTTFGAERIMVSDQGVRYGLLHERLVSLESC